MLHPLTTASLMIEIFKQIISDALGALALRSEVIDTMIAELRDRGHLTEEEIKWIRQEISDQSRQIRSHQAL